MRIVRWLGAFGKASSLSESLEFEFSRAPSEEVCAEMIKRVSTISARVGLLVKHSALIKSFRGDCFSVLIEGKLVKTRKPVRTCFSHNESWVHPIYCGIVVDGAISCSAMNAVRDAASKFGVPVISFDNNGTWKTI